MSEQGNGAWFETQGITKSFSGVHALTDISVSVSRGEILGLVGENGAGKSTLINIATGVHRPEAGTLSLGGTPRHFANPHEATLAGVAVVHQEAELFADLSLAENMFLGPGLPTRGLGWVDWKEAYRTGEEALKRLGVDLPVRTRARNLSVAQRVLAQIASAINLDASVLFLDEPTASLTHKECLVLFERIRNLREMGVAVVYVSHRLEEVLDLCDRVAVLRDGCHVWTRPVQEIGMDEMVHAMVGRTVSQYYPERKREPGGNALEVKGLTDSGGAFEKVNLTLRKDEILGLYGLVGAGRSEVAQAIFGLRKREGGEILLEGNLRLEKGSPAKALDHAIAYLPEDRLTQGVFRNLSVRENAVMAILRRISGLTIVSRKTEAEIASRVIDQTRVRTESTETPIVNLSGGNQQKVVLGRWLETQPEILLLDEPTRGVDVGAKAEIHQIIADLAAGGKAVMLISSELPEILAMSDRVAVMSEGRVVGEFDPSTDSAETIAAAAFPVSDVTRPLVAREPLPGKSAKRSRKRVSGLPSSKPRFDLLAFREAGIGVALLALMAGLAALRPESFLTFANLSDVLSSVSILAVAALGATFVIGGGGIDISVGSMLGLVGAATGMVALQGIPVPFCLLFALAFGALLGAVNMGVSLLGKVHPIIVTLAGLSVYRGLMRQLTGGYEVTGLPDSYRALGDGLSLGVPRVVWFALTVLLLAWILLQRVSFGRQILAVGNSRSAADQIGLPASRLSLLAFAVNGAFIGLASVLWGAYYGKLQTSAGEGLELQAIAAAVIGGCNIMGGSGTALGTFLGACLIGVINNGLTLLQIESYWQPVFIGLFILATVLVDGWLLRRRR